MLNGLCKLIVFVEVLACAVGLGWLIGRSGQGEREQRSLPRRRPRVEVEDIEADYPAVLPARQLEHHPDLRAPIRRRRRQEP